MKFENWGTIDYAEAVEKQLRYVNEVASGEREETVILCNHPAVVTVGRGTKDSDIFAWDGPIYEASRGGRATYHGPSQIVIYPIISLEKVRSKFKERDVRGYLKALEKATVETLAHFNIDSEVRTTECVDDSGEKVSVTGVWCRDKKIASIGIAVKKWVSYHGVAINLFKDETAFQGIHPCGFSSATMTSVEHILDERISLDEISEYVTDIFSENFSA